MTNDDDLDCATLNRCELVFTGKTISEDGELKARFTEVRGNSLKSATVLLTKSAIQAEMRRRSFNANLSMLFHYSERLFLGNLLGQSSPLSDDKTIQQLRLALDQL